MDTRFITAQDEYTALSGSIDCLEDNELQSILEDETVLNDYVELLEEEVEGDIEADAATAQDRVISALSKAGELRQAFRRVVKTQLEFHAS